MTKSVLYDLRTSRNCFHVGTLHLGETEMKCVLTGLSHLYVLQDKPCLLFSQQYDQRQKGKIISLALVNSATLKLGWRRRPAC